MQIRLLFAMLALALPVCAESMPRLVKVGGGFIFQVNDRPFTVLGIQTANSSVYPG